MVLKKIIIISLITLISCEIGGDHGDVLFTYNAFPDILITKSGKLICVYYQGWHHESVADPSVEGKEKGGRIMISESFDLGRNWSAPSILIDTNLDDRDPSIVQMDDGRIICNFFQYHRKSSKRYISVYTTESADQGSSWSKPKQVLEHHAISSPFRKLSNGIVAMTTYKLNGSCYVTFSYDHGKTWQKPTPLYSENRKHDFSEPDLIEIGDTLLVVLRSDSKNMHQVKSTDFGKTWTSLRDLGFVGAAPYLAHLGDDMILMGHRIPATSFRYTKRSSLSWSESMFIDQGIEANGAYPSFALIEPQTLLVSYFYEYSKDIVATIRFKEIAVSNDVFTVGDVISEIGER